MADYFNAIPLAVFNSAGLVGTYAALNGTGFASPIKVLKIYNGSTVGITISFDGVNDHDYYPSGATLIIDIQSNHGTDAVNAMGMWRGRQNQILYGKGSAGTGNLYISGFM